MTYHKFIASDVDDLIYGDAKQERSER